MNTIYSVFLTMQRYGDFRSLTIPMMWHSAYHIWSIIKNFCV